MLVGDVADDLLHHVLEGHDAGVAAVLVQDDGHLEPVAAQQGEQRVEPQAVGDDGRLDHDVLDAGGRALVDGQRDRVLDVDGADHGVLVVEDREAGQAGLAGQLDDGAGPVPLLDGRGAHPRRHDLPGGAGAELDAALHELGGLGVQGALVGGALHEGGELLGAAGRAELLLRLDAHPTHEGVGRVVEQPDGPARRGGEAPHEALGGPRRLERLGQCEVLGDHLAEEHREDRAEAQADRHRDPGHPAVGHARAGERVAHQRRDRGLGEEADRQVGHGDAHLGAGQLGRERLEGGLHAGGGGVTAAGRALHGGPVDGHEGELGGDEDAAHRDEGQRGEQEEPRGHDAAPRMVRETVVRRL